MDENLNRRKLMTPSRSRTVHQERVELSGRSKRSSKRSHGLDRIQELEHELQEERDQLRYHDRSDRRTSRCQSGSPLVHNGHSRDRRSRSLQRESRPRQAGNDIKRDTTKRPTNRSRSPSFSTQDVVKIIQSF
ncbi:unnamed protein product [Parnassius apollo]|uniref:(apollo) hypothetical protein n=1 Tax=Parnassius apollo TaxID=110799 RepID=A0A8S3XM45_PARAO|nr:unnamed protein product [Parnassius apollo]